MAEQPKTPVAQTPVVTTPAFKTGLQKVQSTYIDSIMKQLKDNDITLDPMQIACLNSALARMNELANEDGGSINDFDQSNISSLTQTVALLRLNCAAKPNECGFQIRKFTVPELDKAGKPIWENNKPKVIWAKKFEFFIEGAGNDKLLRTYGVDVKEVRQPWKVREGDDFTYPSFDGLNVTAPKWTPKSYTGPIIRVVYPVITENKDENGKNVVEWLISEREEVAKNLQAHIMQNIRKTTQEAEITAKISTMTLQTMLTDESIRKASKEKDNGGGTIAITVISPAWLSPQSREAIIERKMMNNATKKYPKDFKNAFVATVYENTYEDYDQYREEKKTAADTFNTVTGEIESKSNTTPMPQNPVNPPKIEAKPVPEKAIAQPALASKPVDVEEGPQY